MLKGVVALNLVRRHRLGTAALQSYSISRNLVRQPEHCWGSGCPPTIDVCH
jgi:hypothetical protein